MLMRRESNIRSISKIIACLLFGISIDFSVFAASESYLSEDVGGTVMPHGSGESVEIISARMRIVKEWSGISRFTMSGPGHNVRLTGMRDVSYYAELGASLSGLGTLNVSGEVFYAAPTDETLRSYVAIQASSISPQAQARLASGRVVGGDWSIKSVTDKQVILRNNKPWGLYIIVR
jgi:hypothetical protein